jgi:hypothetical protein
MATPKCLARCLQRRASIFQRLAIAYMIDAEDLIRYCQPSWIWSRLQSLALTSRLLRDESDKREQISQLLCQAASLAMRMPQLHTFILCNGWKRNTAAFIYHIDQHSASITWRGIWHLDFNPAVVDSGESVSSERQYRLQYNPREYSRIILSWRCDLSSSIALPGHSPVVTVADPEGGSLATGATLSSHALAVNLSLRLFYLFIYLKKKKKKNFLVYYKFLSKDTI